MKRLLIALVMVGAAAFFAAPAMADHGRCGYGGGYYGGYGGGYRPYVYQPYPYYYNRSFYTPYSYYRQSFGLYLNVGGGGYGGGHHHHHHHHR
jgi:hypothetical protein